MGRCCCHSLRYCSYPGRHSRAWCHTCLQWQQLLQLQPPQPQVLLRAAVSEGEVVCLVALAAAVRVPPSHQLLALLQQEAQLVLAPVGLPEAVLASVVDVACYMLLLLRMRMMKRMVIWLQLVLPQPSAHRPSMASPWMPEGAWAF